MLWVFSAPARFYRTETRRNLTTYIAGARTHLRSRIFLSTPQNRGLGLLLAARHCRLRNLHRHRLSTEHTPHPRAGTSTAICFPASMKPRRLPWCSSQISTGALRKDPKGRRVHHVHRPHLHRRAGHLRHHLRPPHLRRALHNRYLRSELHRTVRVGDHARQCVLHAPRHCTARGSRY